MKRRLLSLFLAIAMIATMVVSVPMTSFAFNDTALDASKEFDTIKIVRDSSADVEGVSYGYKMTVRHNEDAISTMYVAIMDYAKWLEQVADDGYGGEMPGAKIEENDSLEGIYSSALYGRTLTSSTDPTPDGAIANGIPFNLPISTFETSGTSIFVILGSSNASAPYNVPRIGIGTDGSVLEPQAKVNFDMGTGSLKDSDNNNITSVSVDAGTIGVDDIAAAITAKGGKFAAQDSDNYKFGGWSETDGGTAVDGATWTKTLAENEELTLYATWTEKSTISAGDITINPTSVDFNNNNQEPTLVISDSLTGVTADAITLKYDGSESASGKKDAATYAVTADIASTENYKPVTGYDLGNWTINPVDYTIGTVTKTVNEGDTFTGNQTTIDNATAGIIKDLAGNNVAGTITITGVTSPAASDQSNLSWTFAPTTTDGNYNAASGNNASIVVTQKTAVTPAFGGTKSTYDGAAIDNTDVKASIAQSGEKTFVYGTDFKLQYSTDGTTFSDTAPTNVGTYTVKIVLIGDAADSYKITSGDTVSFEIEKKEVTLNTTNVGTLKEYDGNTKVFKKGAATELAIGDLSLSGVVDGDTVTLGGTLSAAYNAATVADANKITISGLTLGGADAGNYELKTIPDIGAWITPKEITATLKADKQADYTVEYGATIPTINAADFDYVTVVGSETVTGATFTTTATDSSDVGNYPITCSNTNGIVGNYKITSVTGNFVIEATDYTIDNTNALDVPIGTVIKTGLAITVTAANSPVKDKDGNAVAGTVTLVGVSGETTAAADTTYPVGGGKYNFDFTPTVANSNYNAVTNATGVQLKGSKKTEVKGVLTISEPEPTYGENYAVPTATVTGDGITNADWKITYTKDGTTVDFAPSDAGTYTVNLELTDAAKYSWSGDSVTSGTLTIKAKTVTLNAVKFSKTYDGTTDATTLEDGSAFDISKLTVDGATGVNVVADGTLTATYNSKDVADATEVTIAGVKLDNANFALDADALKMAGTIKPIELKATYKGDESTSTKAKTYGDTITSLDGATDFDITGIFATGDSAATILNGVTYTSAGTAATANVGEYDITANTEAMSKNYTLTVDGKIKVTPKAITLTVTPKTGLKYKVAAYDANAVVDVAAEGFVNGDSASYAYTVKDGAEIKNAGSYEVTVGLAAAMKNYTATEAKAIVEIAKADYTKGADVKGTAKIGDKINGITIPGDVIGADGNKVTGTFTITADDSIVAEADQEYKNLSYTFATDAADAANYNPYSGNDGYIKASSKRPVSVTIAVDPVIPVGQPVEVKVNAGELSNTDYKVEYKAEGSDAWTETVPTEPAKYEVHVVLTPDADKKYVLQGTASTTFEIVDKFTITYEKGHFEGAELTDTDLVKAVENGKTLNLDGKVFGNAGNFKQVGWYNKATGQLVSGDITVTAPMTFVAAWEYKVNVVEMKQDGSAKEPVKVTFTDSFDSVPVANPAVSISADPAAEGFVFTKWTAAVQEGATGLAEGTIAAPAELSTTYTAVASGTYPISGTVVLTPNYKGAPVDLTAKKPSHGKYSVVVDGVTTEVQAEDKVIAVDGGATVEVIPTADAGYKVSTVKYGTTKVTADENGKYTFTMPTEPTKLTVSFSSTTGGSTGGGNSGLSTGNPTPKPSASASPEPSGSASPAPSGQPGVSTGEHDAYVYGYPDGSFKAENGITRAETAAIFARALTDYVEGTAYTGSYSDVADDWYTNYVNFLSTRGVITGYEDGTFRPDNNITRREFTAMITRLGEVLEANGTGFPDVADTDWAADNIYTAATKGLVNGYEDGTFRPDNNITRAEAVKIVNAYLGRGTDAAGLANADYTTFPDVTTSHWAYFEIIEAANDHTFTVGTKPEVWTR